MNDQTANTTWQFAYKYCYLRCSSMVVLINSSNLKQQQATLVSCGNKNSFLLKHENNFYKMNQQVNSKSNSTICLRIVWLTWWCDDVTWIIVTMEKTFHHGRKWKAMVFGVVWCKNCEEWYGLVWNRNVLTSSRNCTQNCVAKRCQEPVHCYAQTATL